MCGIFGLITPSTTGIYRPEEEFIENMFIAGALRGQHGTGSYWVHADKLKENADYFKMAGNPYHMLYDKEFKGYYDKLKLKAKAFVGHHRAATRGKHTSENAHPFQSKHITMVHNGTINWGLTKYDKDVEVDSHALTIALSEEGTGILSSVSGAFACVWHDSSDGTLNIAKNDQRPLSLVLTDDNKYFFASEIGMLLWAMYRALPSRKQPKILELKNNQHYKFNLAELGEPEVSPLPEKKYPVQSTNYGCGSDYYRNQKRAQTTYSSRKTGSKVEAATFSIVKTVGPENGVYTYICLSDYGELMWFKSVDKFDGPKDRTWYGELFGPPIIDMFPQHWSTTNAPWYKLNVATVVPVHKHPALGVKINGKYLHNDICIDCGDKLPDNMSSGDVIKVGQAKWRGMCPGCTEVNKYVYSGA